jgi:serine/threonine-protein kinase
MELRDALQQTLGDAYTVEHELRAGGMARVFVAHDTALERKVVVKVLSPNLAARVSASRFRREIMFAAGLQHPHIVPVLSAGETDGLPYFIMPFVEGESLRSLVDSSGALPVRKAVTILKDVARALAYAHERGIVHRDVKPDNILLSGSSAVLADFGVAKAVQSAQETTGTDPDITVTSIGATVGTPAYMAPEQVAADENIDHRADIYAFGVVAYEMLAGAPPFDHRTPQKLMAAHLTEEPPSLTKSGSTLPDPLAQLVGACLEKDPDRRPHSAEQLIGVLEDPSVVSGTYESGLRPIVQQARRSRRLAPAIGAVAVAAAAVMFFTRGPAPDAGGDAPPAGSIAVLPLVNVRGDTADAYFADGMTDEITGALNAVTGLRVASRTAAFAFKNRTATTQEIGQTLNVATILEGTIRREGSRLRLNAQLVDTQDGLALWSQTYEREMRDVFAVQDDIAQAIVSALQSHFGSELATTSTTRRGTEDLEAYDLYLRGRFLFEKRGDTSLRQALVHFHDAVARDPEYAEAYTGIADAFAVLPLYGTAPPDSVLPLALAAANRAIELDSTLAEAYASRGSLLGSSWQWEDAQRDFRRAIALDPDYATAHQWYGENLLVNGRVDEAVSSLQRAVQLDPVSPIMTGSYALALGVAGDMDAAVDRARQAVELDPMPVTRFMLGAVYLYGGRHAEAIETLEAAYAVDASNPTLNGLLGYAFAQAGRTDEARGLLVALESSAGATGGAAAIARIYLGLGSFDEAFEWFGRAADVGDPFFGSESLASTMYDPMRSDPRFAELVRRVGLDVDALR